MARPSPTAAFLLLLVSLLAVVAHCRTLETEPATDASAESNAVDETGPPNPILPAEATALVETGPPNPTEATEVVPAEQEGFLRLPSHRRHRHPCRHGHLQRHLWWALHRGAFDDGLGGHRFHHHRPPPRRRHRLHGERRGAEEVESVAEPDPDRSVADGHDEDVVAVVKPIRDGHDEEDAAAKPWRKEMVWSSFRDGHDAEDVAVKPWMKEMLWRMFRHGLRHHRHHHHHHAEAEEEHEQEKEATRSVKLFHHHDAEEEDEEKKMRKPFHFHYRHHDENEEKTTKPLNHAEDSDSDDEDDEVEEMIRRFRKAIMRQRFGHGRRFHHGRHHQAEEAEQTNGESSQAEEGGVVTWIKGLMNRF